MSHLGQRYSTYLAMSIDTLTVANDTQDASYKHLSLIGISGKKKT